MADEGSQDAEQLRLVKQEEIEQADQSNDQAEDAEKQDQATTEPSTEKVEETTEGVSVNDQNETQDEPKVKETEETPPDKEGKPCPPQMYEARHVLIESEEPAAPPPFPKTLEGFGYKFNASKRI